MQQAMRPGASRCAAADMSLKKTLRVQKMHRREMRFFEATKASNGERWLSF